MRGSIGEHTEYDAVLSARSGAKQMPALYREPPATPHYSGSQALTQINVSSSFARVNASGGLSNLTAEEELDSTPTPCEVLHEDTHTLRRQSE